MLFSANVKDVIPEFLSLLKGTIDSTDIPLNVSRSALQGDPNIKKISNYIVKKVAESLKKLFKQDRERYENSWEDILMDIILFFELQDLLVPNAKIPFAFWFLVTRMLLFLRFCY